MKASLQKEFDKPLVKFGSYAIAFMLVVQFFFLPWLDWRENFRKDIVTHQAKAYSAETLQQAIDNLLSLQNQVVERSSFIDAQITKLDDDAKIALPKNIRTLANKSELKINSIAVNPIATEGSALQSFGISMEAEGTPKQFAAFIEALSQAQTFYYLERVSFFNVRKTSIKYRLLVRTYVKN